MKISEIMTVDPICCAEYETAAAAAMLMQELNVGAIPVVDDKINCRLTGMVTDRDLCLSIVAEGRNAKSVKLKDCMTSSRR